MWVPYLKMGRLIDLETPHEGLRNGEVKVPVRMLSRTLGYIFDVPKEWTKGLMGGPGDTGHLEVETDLLEGTETPLDAAESVRVLLTLEEGAEVPRGDLEWIFSMGSKKFQNMAHDLPAVSYALHHAETALHLLLFLGEEFIK